MKIIFGQRYRTYQNALKMANLLSLQDRREESSLKFAKKWVENETAANLFKPNMSGGMQTRGRETFNVTFANTERFRKSAVIHMQN